MQWVVLVTIIVIFLGLSLLWAVAETDMEDDIHLTRLRVPLAQHVREINHPFQLKSDTKNTLEVPDWLHPSNRHLPLRTIPAPASKMLAVVCGNTPHSLVGDWLTVLEDTNSPRNLDALYPGILPRGVRVDNICWSPDGQQLAVIGRSEAALILYLVQYNTQLIWFATPIIQIPQAAHSVELYHLSWSPDSARLVMQTDTNQLFAYAFDDTQDWLEFEGVCAFQQLDWAEDGSGLWAISAENQHYWLPLNGDAVQLVTLTN